MNGYERIEAALKGKQTDKVPVLLHNFQMAAREAGITQKEYRNDPKKIAESFIKSVEKYNYDGIYVDIDTVTLAGAVGVPVDFPVDSPARSHEPFLYELEDLYSLKHIDILSYKYINVWLDAVRLLCEYFKNEIFIRGNCDAAPFSLASAIRAPANWMMDIIDPEKEESVFMLLDYCEQITGDFITCMSQTGTHMISNGDSPAGPSMISPAMYRKFAIPSEKKMIEIAHKNNLPYCLHICGNIDQILEYIPETGTDGIELDQMTNIRKAYDVFAGKITFFGNIDPGGVLALGSPELVREKTEELLKLYAGDPYFVLNAGCSLPPDTPGKNLKTMIDTARGFK